VVTGSIRLRMPRGRESLPERGTERFQNDTSALGPAVVRPLPAIGERSLRLQIESGDRAAMRRKKERKKKRKEGKERKGNCNGAIIYTDTRHSRSSDSRHSERDGCECGVLDLARAREMALPGAQRRGPDEK